MPIFDTVVDDVIATVHDAIRKDIELYAKSGVKPGITEQYFAENRAKLKEYLDQKLDSLLRAKCDVKFLKKHIKYSCRSFILYYKDGPEQIMGDGQLARFLEAKIKYILEKKDAINNDKQAKEDHLTNKQRVKNYLLSTELLDLSLDKETKSDAEVAAEVEQELKNFLLLNCVNQFWLKSTEQKDKQKKTKNEELKEVNKLWQESLDGNVTTENSKQKSVSQKKRLSQTYSESKLRFRPIL